MPLKKLFQNIHGFCSPPSAPFVFMVINPHHTAKHKLPYVELPGHRRLPGSGVRDVAGEWSPTRKELPIAHYSSQVGIAPPI
jgi:hypothetical protein